MLDCVLKKQDNLGMSIINKGVKYCPKRSLNRGSPVLSTTMHMP